MKLVTSSNYLPIIRRLFCTEVCVVIGIFLIFGCAEVSQKNQFAAGCSEDSDPVSENKYVPDNSGGGSSGGSTGGSSGGSTGSSSSSDTTAPTISAPPTSGATDVSVSSDITIPFSEAIDSSTINSINITVVDNSSYVVSGVWTYSGTTATFNPISDLSYSTTYTVTVGTGVKDSAGNALGSALSWNFTTTMAPWSGIKQLGTSGNEGAYGITSDSSGNVYVAGGTYGDLDGNTHAGMSDIFIVKYSSSGEKQWTRQLGTASSDIGYSITTGASGNVYVTGSTEGDLDGNNDGDSDIFVVKYSSSGEKQWTRQLGSQNDDIGWGITSDSSGNIYVTGQCNASFDGQAYAGETDIFVVKYSSSGEKQWTRQLGTSSPTSYEQALGITSDSSGNVYVTGITNGNLDNNTNAGGWDLFVMKFNSDGEKQWTQQLGTSVNDTARGITSDSSGNVYVTGKTEGNLYGTNAGETDIFVVKYSSSGEKQWTRQLGTQNREWGRSITSDSSGNVYVTGDTEGDLDNNTNAGSSDLFIVKYSSSGEKQWTRQLGTASGDIGYSITTGASGNVYVTGSTEGDLDGNNAGNSDVFVVKYSSDGERQ